jgi:hypothetical protein
MYGWLHRFGLVAMVLVGMLSGGLAGRGADPETPPTVRLIIDYGDGVEKHFTALAWKDGMTILDVLEAAKAHARGIKFTCRGKESTAFLTEMDGLENEGSGKNWVFRVNDKLGTKSFAITPVKAADTVLWRFGEYR